MNRFLRVAYITCFLYTLSGLGLEGFTGLEFPIFCFVALYAGLLVFMLQGVIPTLEKFRLLLQICGVMITICGFLPLIHHSLGFIIVYLLNAAITFVLAVKLNYNSIHRDFAAKFKFSIIVMMLIFAVALILSGGTDTFINQEHMRNATQHAVPCFIVTLAMGVLLLRGLRAVIGIVDERQFNKRQLIDTIIFFAACIVFWATDALNLITRGLEWMLSTIIMPIINQIAYWLSSLFDLMVNQNPLPMGTDAPVTPAPTYDIELTPPPEGVIDPSNNGSTQVDFEFFKYMVMIAAALLVIVILWIIVTKLLKRGKHGSSIGYPNETREDLGIMLDDRTERPISRFNRNPRMRIRYLYQEFMRHLSLGGVSIEKSDTCADIEKRSRIAIFSKQDEIAEFSDVYRKARYDMDTEPVNDDAERAKRLYNSIRIK